ncbi:MAG: hypothetical protein K0Q43_747 [Ramlibacter sp.]|nr:hypothetical protein [Ramlibacter sp.]
MPQAGSQHKHAHYGIDSGLEPPGANCGCAGHDNPGSKGNYQGHGDSGGNETDEVEKKVG